MPAVSKHRTGCDCLNRTRDVIVEDRNARCPYCDDPYIEALCAYKLLFECAYYTASAYGERERFTEPCIILRKDCPEGCTYTSRWGVYEGVDRPWLGSTSCTVPLITTPQTGPCVGESITCDYPECLDVTVTFEDDEGTKTLTRTICFAGYFDDTLIQGGVYVAYTDPEYRTPTDTVTLTLSGDDVEATFVASAKIYCPYTEGTHAIAVDFEVILSNSLPCPGFAPYQCSSFTAYPDSATCEDIVTYGFSVDRYAIIDAVPACVAAGCNVSIVDSVDFAPSTSCDICADIPTTIGREIIPAWTKGCAWTADPPPDDDNAEAAFTKWTLTVTSATTATIVGTTRNGFTATYTVDDFDCYGRSTAHLTSYDRALIGIPKCLCVAPVNPPVSPADCSSSFCDSGAPTRYFAHDAITACSVEVIPAGSFLYTRGLALPAEVWEAIGTFTDCDYFARVFTYTPAVTCTTWPGQILSVVAVSRPPIDGCSPPAGYSADDFDRALQRFLFCYNGDTDLYELKHSDCDLFSCCDPQIGNIQGDLYCCCEGVTTECCGDSLVPLTLTASDGTNSVTLTYDGSFFWQGTGTLAGCTDAEWTLYCGGSDVNGWYFNGTGAGAGTSMTAVSCDPVHITNTTPWTTDCGGTYTVDITP